MDVKELTNYVRQNVVIKDELDGLSQRQVEIKKRITEGVKEIGYESDRGHIVVDIADEVTGIAKVVYQRKVSKSLDVDLAETILNTKGLTERCSRQIFAINEDEIMAAFYEGLLTEEDIDTMFPSRVSWALVMSKS